MQGGGFSHPRLVINSSVTTSPTLAGERMLLIPKVSILSEQIQTYTQTEKTKEKPQQPFLLSMVYINRCTSMVVKLITPLLSSQDIPLYTQLTLQF